MVPHLRFKYCDIARRASVVWTTVINEKPLNFFFFSFCSR